MVSAEMVECESSHWVQLGSTHKLRLRPVYEISQPDLQLHKALHFAASPYGGPIAVCHRANGASSLALSFYSCSGHSYKENVELSGEVLSMEWSRTHRLVVIGRNGLLWLFSPRGQLLRELELGSSRKDGAVIVEGRLFGADRDSGICLLDNLLTLSLANHISELSEPVYWKMHLLAGDLPTAWLAVRPQAQLTAVVVAYQTTIYRAAQGDKLKRIDFASAPSDGSFTRMNADWSNRNIFLYHSSNIIQVVLHDLSAVLAEIRLNGSEEIRPSAFFAVSSTAIAFQLSSRLIQFFSFKEPKEVHEYRADFCVMGEEPDGVKIFNRSLRSPQDQQGLVFASIVAQDEVDVLETGSNAPGSNLYWAEKRLMQKQTKVNPHEHLTAVSDVQTAISQCLRAAAFVRSPAQQKMLLRAARLGMVFSGGYDSEQMVALLRHFRVINECHHPRVGIPITNPQLLELSQESLLERLVELGHFGLSGRMAEWLGDKAALDRVVVSWVKHVIQAAAAKHEDAAVVYQKIYSKLQHYPHFSFADAAEKALEAKSLDLARLLVKKETNEERQVELLLRFGDMAEALGYAAVSQQPTLIHLVIRHLMRTLSKEQIELEIRKIPQAHCVYREYVRQKSGALILSSLRQGSEHDRTLFFHLDSALSHSSGPFQDDERAESLKQAAASAKEMRDPHLEQLLKECGQRPDTIRQAFIAAVADPEATKRIRDEAKLSDKQFWMWTIEGLASQRRWSHLAECTKKRPPVGYLPVVRACVRNKNKDEAEKYLEKITAYIEIVDALLEVGQVMKAAKMALDRKDEATLKRIHRRPNLHARFITEISQMLQQL